MIKYQGIKYSVPISYVGKDITVLDEDNVIHLYYNNELVCSYTKNSKFKYNYKEDDYIDILQNSCFDRKNKEEIKKYIEKNISSLDGINIERSDDNDRKY